MRLRTLALVAAGAIPCALGQISDQVFEQLAAARTRLGAPRLERDPALDALARSRAEELAARPPDRRLAGRESITRTLAARGDRRVLQAWERLDLSRGATEPARHFFRRWQRSPGAWRRALAPTTTRIGLATARAPDGWLIFLAILTEDRPAAFDAAAWEEATLAAVNHLRAARGLAPLRADPELAAVARRHSEDMASRGFFDHRDPEGRGLAFRLHRAGVRHQQVKENIAVNLGQADPVRTAVESWDNSPLHLAAMIDPDLHLSGVGIARASDGRIFFTQLFAGDGGKP